ncbi:MAG TPA: PQQ-binding-like beta-propeller repeat protein [Gemmataceae bacterium]|nr:PQQ-binding-like beta-propeller repeat protein [Gemmataceae bacterium]
MRWFRPLALLMLATSTAAAADWPQWLGPNRDGATAEKVAPWKGQLIVAWRKAVGEGHSSPVVSNGKVYLHYRVPNKESEAVECFEAATGKQLWLNEYQRDAFKGLFGSGPRGTPAVVEGKIYSFGPTGILTCTETATGKTVWQSDTRKVFNSPKLTFGDSTSPLVVGNKVLVNVGAKGASVVAFDKDKGDVLWKSLDDAASYSSPILMGKDKNQSVVFLTQLGVVGLNVDDGALQWRFPFKDKLFESSTTPIRVGDKLLVSSISLGTAFLDIENKDGKMAANQLWKTDALTCYFSTPVPVGTDHVYLVTGSPIPGGKSSLHCVDAKTGKALWSKGGVGKYHASLMRTGDNKLLMVEEAGNLVFIDPDPKAYKELARAKICGNTWAHPALADGRLYIRDDKELVCVEVGK